MPKPAKHPEYVKWLHDQPCCITGIEGPSVAVHHLTSLVHGNRISKNDRYCVPLRHELHQYGKFAVHEMNVESFEAHHGVDLTALAEHCWGKWESENV